MTGIERFLQIMDADIEIFDEPDAVPLTDVKGDIDAGGSVTCGNVSGDIDAGGSVRCRR